MKGPEERGEADQDRLRGRDEEKGQAGVGGVRKIPILNGLTTIKFSTLELLFFISGGGAVLKRNASVRSSGARFAFKSQPNSPGIWVLN